MLAIYTLCTVKHVYFNVKKTEEMKLHIIPFSVYNRLTNLVFDIEEILNSNIDRELIGDLLEDWEIITQIMTKINSGTTTGRLCYSS